jgi:hypothetical protein
MNIDYIMPWVERQLPLYDEYWELRTRIGYRVAQATQLRLNKTAYIEARWSSGYDPNEYKFFSNIDDTKSYIERSLIERGYKFLPEELRILL